MQLLKPMSNRLLTTGTIPRCKAHITRRAHFLNHYSVGHQQNPSERHCGALLHFCDVRVLRGLARTRSLWQLCLIGVEYIGDGIGHDNKGRLHSCVIIDGTVFFTEALVGTNVITVDFRLRHARDSHDECELQWDVWRTTFSSPGRLHTAPKSYIRDRTLHHTGSITHVLVHEEGEELLFGGVNLGRSEGVTARHEIVHLSLQLKALEKWSWKEVQCERIWMKGLGNRLQQKITNQQYFICEMEGDDDRWIYLTIWTLLQQPGSTIKTRHRRNMGYVATANVACRLQSLPKLTLLSWSWARFLSLTQSELRLCSANHTAYISNLPCDWLSIVWAYSEKEQENRGPGQVSGTQLKIGDPSFTGARSFWVQVTTESKGRAPE